MEYCTVPHSTKGQTGAIFPRPRKMLFPAPKNTEDACFSSTHEINTSPIRPWSAVPWCTVHYPFLARYVLHIEQTLKAKSEAIRATRTQNRKMRRENASNALPKNANALPIFRKVRNQYDPKLLEYSIFMFGYHDFFTSPKHTKKRDFPDYHSHPIDRDILNPKKPNPRNLQIRDSALPKFGGCVTFFW